MIAVAAIVFAAISAGAVLFQLALALGVPWGSYAMGGKFPGRFPPAMRGAAVVQGALLCLMAAVVVSRAGLAFQRWSPAAAWLIWIVVGLGVVSLVLNTITPSPGERRIWGPVALVMVISSLVVAVGAG
jgi:hypothetical protein